MAPSQVVTYAVDDETVVSFEIEPLEGFTPAGVRDVAGRVGEAIEPVLAMARLVSAKARELRPDGVEVKFGVKVSGTADWIVARAASEGNIEVTLSWHPTSSAVAGPAAGG